MSTITDATSLVTTTAPIADVSSSSPAKSKEAVNLQGRSVDPISSTEELSYKGAALRAEEISRIDSQYPNLKRINFTDTTIDGKLVLSNKDVRQLFPKHPNLKVDGLFANFRTFMKSQLTVEEGKQIDAATEKLKKSFLETFGTDLDQDISPDFIQNNTVKCVLWFLENFEPFLETLSPSATSEIVFEKAKEGTIESIEKFKILFNETDLLKMALAVLNQREAISKIVESRMQESSSISKIANKIAKIFHIQVSEFEVDLFVEYLVENYPAGRKFLEEQDLTAEGIQKFVKEYVPVNFFTSAPVEAVSYIQQQKFAAA
jgi:hypothetical protein